MITNRQNTVSPHNNKIEMGSPEFRPTLIPVLHASSPLCICEPLLLAGDIYKMTAVGLGSPYAVIFVDSLDGLDVPRLGKRLEYHALFPDGAHAVFAQQTADGVKARVWLRGKGESATSCEGACAAHVVSLLLGSPRETADVALPGGTYRVTWDRFGDNQITASFAANSGPAAA